MRPDLDLLSLPGPRRFWRRLAGAVDAGRCVALACPSTSVADALEAVARSARQHRYWDLTAADVEGFLAPGESSVHAAHRTLGLPVPPPGARADPRDLHRRGPAGRRVLWVDATDATPEELQPWWRFVASVETSGRAEPPAQRCVVVTATLDARLDPLPVDRAAALRLWWWAVIGPLDVLTWVAERADGPLDPCLADCIVELSSFDLDLADLLVAQSDPYWHGDLRCVTQLLTGYWDGLGRPAVPSLNGAAATANHPPLAVQDAWRNGHVGWWRNGLAVHPALVAAADGQDAVKTLLWRGQIRTLLPRIEECRAVLSATASRHELELEETLRRARNHLAHTRPLFSRQLAQLDGVMHRAGGLFASPHSRRSHTSVNRRK